MLKKIFFYYAILSIPNLFLFTPIFIFSILKNNISLRNILSYLKKNKDLFFLFIFLLSGVVLNITDPLYFKEIQFYIILFFSIFFFKTYKINYRNFVSLIFNINIFLLLYIITIIFFNNIIMDCLVSRAGYYDLFQKINNKFVIFNINEFNCHLNSSKIEFSHISSFVFKLLLLNYINLISYILNNDQLKKLINIFIFIFTTLMIISVGSRVAFVINILSFFLIFFNLINEKNYKLIIISILSLVVISLLFNNKKNANFLNFFILDKEIFLDLEKYKYTIDTEELNNNNFDSKEIKYKYFHNENIFYRLNKLYNFKFTDLLKSNRNLEISNFVKNLKLDNPEFQNFYHNFFFNIYLTYGNISIFLVIFFFILLKDFMLKSLKILNLKNLLLNLFTLLNIIIFFLTDAYFNSLPNYLIVFVLIIYLIKDYLNENQDKLFHEKKIR